MGPTNLALVRLFKADQALRQAQARLDQTTKNVRVHGLRLKELQGRLSETQTRLKDNQSHAANLELDIRSRDAQIEKLRAQQANTHNHKEYQAFLVEINTQKVDKARTEEQALTVMESIEKLTAEVKELSGQVETEEKKAEQMRQEIGEKSAAIQAEIDALKGPRDEAAGAVPARAREMFEKLADRYEGEALAALERPDRRRRHP